MLLKFLFKQLSLTHQVNFIKKLGMVVGTRNQDGRLIYLYMIHNLFAEIIYENDNPKLKVEGLVLKDGVIT
ncbi:MAG: hypothetical protein ABIR06_12295 [Cyclobacteriaceae bacterium]